MFFLTDRLVFVQLMEIAEVTKMEIPEVTKMEIPVHAYHENKMCIAVLHCKGESTKLSVLLLGPFKLLTQVLNKSLVPCVVIWDLFQLDKVPPKVSQAWLAQV